MKKAISLILIAALISAVICTSALAAGERSARDEIMDTVRNFLESYTVETLLYTDRDLTANTVADKTALMPIGAESLTFEISGGISTIVQMQENIAYVEAKAEYWKGIRQMQDIYRKDLELTYSFEEVNITKNTAKAVVYEYATFTYTDCTKPTFVETIYTIDLVNLSGRWLIADVTDNDWFDAEHKDTDKFDAEVAISEFKACLEANEPCVVIGPEISTIVADDTIRFYNGENAAAYAYTYSGNDGTLTTQPYYNEKFRGIEGKDCMNFASQCIWAGFYGSQTTTDIEAHKLPMDEKGDSTWYSDSNSSTSSWTSCKYFRNYLTGEIDGTTGSNAAQDVGMKATLICVPTGSLISDKININSLVGAIAHVNGMQNGKVVKYGHAIVITDVTGPSGTEIYYCSHTSNRQHVKLADFRNEDTLIIIPWCMRCGSSQDNLVKADMLRPVTVGTTQTISASVKSTYFPSGGATPGIDLGNLTITVTSPNKKEVKVYTANSHAIQFSISYEFTQAGLYEVECKLEYGESTTFYVRAVDIA